ncbi:MAG: hypothetical protein ACFFBP_11290 [Promethearchaeota archaeon]
MGKIIQDIWILTKTGISVYNRVYDPEKLDQQLFAMLMSAINSFADEVYIGGISSFELSDKKFSIIKHNDFLFVANSDPKVKCKKVVNELEAISEKFFKAYPHNVLENWDGDVSIFDNFEDHIQDSVQKKLNNFMAMI